MTRETDVKFDDLVDAYFAAREYADAATELCDYHARKLRILEELFGFSLRAEESGDATAEPGPRSRMTSNHDREHVRHIAARCIDASAEALVPFGIYLEGSPGPLEGALVEAHRQRLEDLRQAYMDELRRTCAAALLKLAPSLASKRFTQEQLLARGLPRMAPDPLDFI